VGGGDGCRAEGGRAAGTHLVNRAMYTALFQSHFQYLTELHSVVQVRVPPGQGSGRRWGTGVGAVHNWRGEMMGPER
jgi:hypothetical protein